MPNEIKLRRGSAAPSASSFAVGEPAWDGTNKRLYVKASDNTMVLINPENDTLIPLSDETTALTASSTVAKVTIPYWPRATVLTSSPIWMVNTAPTGAALQFDIQVGGSSIYLPASGGTYPTIAISGTNSTSSAGTFTTAFTASPAIALGSSVTFFVRQIGSTVAGAGLKVVIPNRRAS